MTVGIVGLGLIGGSFAKAYHEAGETVLACNRTEDTLRFAMLSGAVDASSPRRISEAAILSSSPCSPRLPKHF